MSEEEKPTTPAAEETAAPAAAPKEEESTAEFAPVVRPFDFSLIGIGIASTEAIKFHSLRCYFSILFPSI